MTGLCPVPPYRLLTMLTEEDVRAALKGVKYPGFSRDIVSFGLVKAISLENNDVTVVMEIQTKDEKVPRQIYKDSQEALNELPDVGLVTVTINVKDAPGQSNEAPQGKTGIPGVKKVIAVASGKGGVGKSTVATNLALSLSKQGLRVALCDCDLYGPSISMMFGVKDAKPVANDNDEIIPIEAHGIQLMSMGFLLDDTSPVIVRGPLATRYIQQFLRQVAWDNVDVLVLDLPPGTGDIQLTIVQTVALEGAVIVTTPQEVALTDARKAVTMFAKVNVPILGIVENMAWFECDHGQKYFLFGEGGGKAEAKRLKVPLLAQIPIDPPTRVGGDKGLPVALMAPAESAASAAFADVADQLRMKLV